MIHVHSYIHTYFHDLTPPPPPSFLGPLSPLSQVLGKSCKPIPVMVMGAFLGKKYPVKKYANVALIVAGVALFMQSGHGAGKPGGESGGQVRGLRPTYIPMCKGLNEGVGGMCGGAA